MVLIELLAGPITAFIGWLGYPGILILMAMESMIFPVPSEAVMPFAGFLIAEGKLTFTGVIFFSTLGSIIGSLISYYIGAWGGRPILKKYGKYLCLNNHHLDVTEKFFKTHGELTIFICRFIPVVRHLISIPAGIGKMNLARFIVFTAIGAVIWNAFLAYMGYLLKSNWEEVIKYSSLLDVFVILVLILAGTYYFYKYSTFCRTVIRPKKALE
jgi:membrane protein DedA with SNARE-associated domain